MKMAIAEMPIQKIWIIAEARLNEDNNPTSTIDAAAPFVAKYATDSDLTR